MRLLKKTFIYAIGNFGAKGINMLLVPLLTLYLTKEELGQYDLVFVTALLFIPVLSLQLSDALFRWLISENKKDKQIQIITTIYCYYFLIMTLVSVSFLFISSLFQISATPMQFAYLISQMMYLLVLQTARGLAHTKLYAFSGIISSFFIVTLSLCSLEFTSLKVDGLLLSAITSYVITSSIVMAKIKLNIYFNYRYFSLKKLKKYIKYSLPLIPNTISWWGITMATRYIIFIKLGIAANGLYAISAKIPALLTIITSFFTLAWQEELIIRENTSDDDARGIFKKYYTLLLSSLFILMPFSYILLLVIVPPAFIESWKYVYFLLLAAVFQALSGFLGAQYLNSKKTKKLFYTSIIAMFVTLTLSYTLIDQYGLQAISLSTFIGMFLMFVLRLYDSKISQNCFSDLIIIIFLIALSYSLQIALSRSINPLIISLVGVILFLSFNKSLILKVLLLKTSNTEQ